MNVRWILKKLIGKTKTLDKQVWLFSSFSGDYSDSPKAVSERVHEKYPQIKIVWALNENSMRNCPEYAEAVRYGSLDHDEYKDIAGVIIDNVWADTIARKYKGKLRKNIKNKISVYLKSRKNQKIYSLWHGTPLKKMDRDQLGNEDIDGFISNNNIKMIVSNQHTARVMQWNTFNKVPILELGMARNDILFSNVNTVELKKRLGLPIDKKIVLFAPTFRNDGKDVEGKNINRSGLNQINEFDLNQLFISLKSRFDGEWAIVCRFHYHVSSLVDWDELEKKHKGCFINGNKSPDMAEYLCCSDVLITDASSSMFDFALTKKPCFLYFPDYDYYNGIERGMYFDLSELPFPVSMKFNKLLDDINNFDSIRYEIGIDSLMDSLKDVDDGCASDRIANLIYKESVHE